MGVCTTLYDTLMVSDTEEPSGHSEGDTRPGLTRQKPKDLSACESEELWCVEGCGLYDTLMESDEPLKQDTQVGNFAFLLPMLFLHYSINERLVSALRCDVQAPT